MESRKISKGTARKSTTIIRSEDKIRLLECSLKPTDKELNERIANCKALGKRIVELEQQLLNAERDCNKELSPPLE